VTSLTLSGQKVNLKEIKEEVQNGVKIFNIITNDIKINFKEDLEYYWYSEYSGEQSTKGASGGRLLHGSYSFFDEEGRLNWQGYYKYGLQDSTWFFWDDNGELTSKSTWKDGIEVYRKLIYEDGRYIESYGAIGYPNYWYRQYSNKNVLIIDTKTIISKPYPVRETFEYYPNGKTIKRHFYSCGFFNYYGEYKEYSTDGKLISIGYYDKQYYLGLKTGEWKFYNEEKRKFDTVRYKTQDIEDKLTAIRAIGSMTLNPKSNEWTKTGIWYYIRNDSIIDKRNMDSPTLETITNLTDTIHVGETASNTIKLIKNSSGLFEIPIILNGVLKINFIFDSGASEVSVSPDVALTLIRTGTISENDWLQDQTYVFADGSKAKSKRFVIRQLIIGNQTLSNIEASISNSIEAPMLIGQNVMNKLGYISIDYDKQLLIIKSNK
jgi:predicted aspartyl protease/antitoxin component YwqK of YwqJK toxin-antitoxin module